jgi:hypothetical protein
MVSLQLASVFEATAFARTVVASLHADDYWKPDRIRGSTNLRPLFWDVYVKKHADYGYLYIKVHVGSGVLTIVGCHLPKLKESIVLANGRRVNL